MKIERIMKSAMGKNIIFDPKWAELFKLVTVSVKSNYAIVYKYKRCPVNGRMKRNGQELVSRIIMGALPGQVVDHKNGITLDNREENLRICTQGENCINRTGKEKGIKKSKSGNEKWQASITFKRKQYYLGTYATKTEASRVRDEAANFLHKEFANLNNSENNKSYLAIKKQSSSRFPGVYFRKKNSKWACMYYAGNGKKIYLGDFKNENDAKEKYEKYVSENNLKMGSKRGHYNS